MNEGDIVLASLPQADGRVKSLPPFYSAASHLLVTRSSAASALNSSNSWPALTTEHKTMSSGRSD